MVWKVKVKGRDLFESTGIPQTNTHIFVIQFKCMLLTIHVCDVKFDVFGGKFASFIEF